jgi:hypothetical protein
VRDARDFFGHAAGVGFAFDYAGASDQEERICCAQPQRAQRYFVRRMRAHALHAIL